MTGDWANTTGDRWDGQATSASAATDAYRTLGVSPTVSDGELRRAYYRLAQLHHPDHNGGSRGSAERFALIQDAYIAALNSRRIDTMPPLRAFESRVTPDAWAEEEPAVETPPVPDSEPSVVQLQVDPQLPEPSFRSAWAEPWLEARIVELERQLAAEREAAEREAVRRRAIEAHARVARNEAAMLRAAAADVSTWDGVERRKSPRRLSDWFRGL